MEKNISVLQKVIISTIANVEFSDNEKILQVFTTEGKLIAINPEYLEFKLKSSEEAFQHLYNEKIKLEAMWEETRKKLQEQRTMKRDLLDRALEAMFPLLHFATRGSKIGKRPTKKQAEELKKAKAFFAEINSSDSQYLQ